MIKQAQSVSVRIRKVLMTRLEKEILRMEGLKEYEREYWTKYQLLCGIDEAGRGPLAGPVVAGAVILPVECDILYINDSKKLSAKKREELYDEIMDKHPLLKYKPWLHNSDAHYLWDIAEPDRELDPRIEEFLRKYKIL